jgi:hypothetical protein
MKDIKPIDLSNFDGPLKPKGGKPDINPSKISDSLDSYIQNLEQKHIDGETNQNRAVLNDYKSAVDLLKKAYMLDNNLPDLKVSLKKSQNYLYEQAPIYKDAMFTQLPSDVIS